MMEPILTVKSLDSTTLTVEFNSRNGVSHYIIRVENSNGFFREVAASSSPAEIESLAPYTEYSLSIMAVNTAGRSQPSIPVTGKTVLAPPQLSSSSTSNSSIVVSWDPVAHAVQYTLSICKLDSNTSMGVYNTSNTSLTFSGLDAGSLYIITCFAWDLEGRKGDSSNVKQATRKQALRQLSVCDCTLCVYSSIQSTTSSSCTLSVVGCGEVHTIQVTASNEAGPSYPSSPSLALVESSEGNCTLTWKPVGHADSYMALFETAGSSVETCNTTSNNCTFHCPCGQTYLLSVLAFNHAGSSPQGQVLNYTTSPDMMEPILTVNTDTLEISWMPSRGAVLYETRAAHSSEVILCNDTAPLCVLSGLSCDTAYSVVVIPCSDVSGWNRACKAHTKDTAPCMPNNVMLNPKNSSCVTVSWTGNNRAANYTVSANGDDDKHICSTNKSSCDITDLSCGSTYEVSVEATSTAGPSLPSYSEFLETEPCCPVNLTVDQVTQAITNVSWSHAKGARLFIATLTSSRGHARCHTQDSHCLMGCITCSTNYTVTMEAISHNGRRSNCTYQGFSSSPCCQSGVKLYSTTSNSLRVYWRSTGSNHSSIAEMVGRNSNYNCTAAPGDNSCDFGSVQCGDVYHVVVAPLTQEGSKVQFCPKRLYSVIYRGKRSVD
uniref:Fibronectin type III domain containing 7 n=1 Tax=Neolamprologus brichardi TaxID=32507 RepID=A0A3Q4N583_NEOBR